jgi:hypothetical protein
MQQAEKYLGGRNLPLASHVLFRFRHHQGKNAHQYVVFATSLGEFDNRDSKNIELENVVDSARDKSLGYQKVSRLIRLSTEHRAETFLNLKTMKTWKTQLP